MKKKSVDEKLYESALYVQIGAFLVGFGGFFLCLANARLGVAAALLVASVATLLGASRMRRTIRRKVVGRIQRRVADDVLGELRYADEDWWAANVTVEGKNIGFRIGGDTAPDPRLIAHAREIVGSYGAFRSKISAFLGVESEKRERFADEIRSLDIEDVSLLSPEQPDDGMIYFGGSAGDRLWRCDYVGRTPCNLGFDG